MADPDPATLLARWEALGRPPIPIATNDRRLVWTTIAVSFARNALFH
jgi:hypothetical protein